MKYEDRVNIFRERIAEVIANSGLNHSRFAQSIGVDRSTLSQLLSNQNLRLPRADTIASIAERYQVSVDWLLGLTNEGRLGADLLRGPLEFEDFSESSANQRLLEWHQEASNYRVRYVPATLPDLIKTEQTASYEFRRYGVGRTDQSIRDTHVLLVQQRQVESEMEVCQSLQDIEAFALGEGIWRDLPLADRIPPARTHDRAGGRTVSALPLVPVRRTRGLHRSVHAVWSAARRDFYRPVLPGTEQSGARSSFLKKV